MQEFDIIARYFAPLAARDKAARGLNDDAAVFAPPAGHEVVVTTDAIVEGVHFTGKETPQLIAQKLLRVNLSDLAAMGAKPYGYTLVMMVPASVDEAWIAGFAEGLKNDQEEFGLTLLGGDTTKTTGPLSLSATLFGYVPHGQALSRTGAQLSDVVYVTGTIGDATLGLRVAQSKLAANEALLKRYQLPEPRVAFAEKLRGIVHACMDISDGLVQDLGHICECSGVGAEIAFASLPLSHEARALLAKNATLRETILTGGDDYELLFTAPFAAAFALQKIAKEAGVHVTQIGHITEHKDVRVMDDGGKEIPLERKGYQHF